MFAVFKICTCSDNVILTNDNISFPSIALRDFRCMHACITLACMHARNTCSYIKGYILYIATRTHVAIYMAIASYMMNCLKFIPCTTILCMLVCFIASASVHVEYERSGMCDVSDDKVAII